ncbi:MAG: hypothetical protein CUN56_04325 [Phototrophicales bacterium]|nr:MAG: hypothetical protein CUN56_04325 [Phototrophicales bacterium]
MAGKILLFVLIVLASAFRVEAQPDFELRNIILRYDGTHELGTFAVVVCNHAIIPARDFEINLEANDTTITIVGERLNQGCMHFFDAESSFDVFGLQDGQTVTVTATLQDQTLQQDIVVDTLSHQGERSNPDMYEACMQSGSHADCYHLMFDTPTPDEIKVQSGSYFVITPIDHERLAAFYLFDLLQCSQNISEYFAVDAPPVIMRRLIISDGYSGSYAAVDDITTLNTDAGFRSMGANLPNWWNQINNGGCGDPHETTHIFVSETVLPGWLNEGLATFMEDTSRTNHHSPIPVRCLFDENKFATEYAGEVTFTNLMNDQFDPTVPSIYYYFSAACFWVYLEDQYGQETIQQIVQR